MIGNNDDFQLFLSEKQIADRVREIAGQLNEDFKEKQATLISVLTGSVIFTSDLIRNINFDHSLTFAKIKSYNGTRSTNTFDLQIGLNSFPEGEHLVVVEDIVDTGNTLNFLINELQKNKPGSISVVALLMKPEVYNHPHKIDYVGFKIPDHFVVGYGMDLDDKYRNLKDIYIKNTNHEK